MGGRVAHHANTCLDLEGWGGHAWLHLDLIVVVVLSNACRLELDLVVVVVCHHRVRLDLYLVATNLLELHLVVGQGHIWLDLDLIVEVWLEVHLVGLVGLQQEGELLQAGEQLRMVGDTSDRAKKGSCVGEKGDRVGGELEGEASLLDHLHTWLPLRLLENALVLLDYCLRLLEYSLSLRKHVLGLLQKSLGLLCDCLGLLEYFCLHDRGLLDQGLGLLDNCLGLLKYILEDHRGLEGGWGLF